MDHLIFFQKGDFFLFYPARLCSFLYSAGSVLIILRNAVHTLERILQASLGYVEFLRKLRDGYPPVNIGAYPFYFFFLCIAQTQIV